MDRFEAVIADDLESTADHTVRDLQGGIVDGHRTGSPRLSYSVPAVIPLKSTEPDLRKGHGAVLGIPGPRPGASVPPLSTDTGPAIVPVTTREPALIEPLGGCWAGEERGCALDLPGRLFKQ